LPATCKPASPIWSVQLHMRVGSRRSFMAHDLMQRESDLRQRLRHRLSLAPSPSYPSGLRAVCAWMIPHSSPPLFSEAWDDGVLMGLGWSLLDNPGHPAGHRKSAGRKFYLW